MSWIFVQQIDGSFKGSDEKSFHANQYLWQIQNITGWTVKIDGHLRKEVPDDFNSLKMSAISYEIRLRNFWFLFTWVEFLFNKLTDHSKVPMRKVSMQINTFDKSKTLLAVRSNLTGIWEKKYPMNSIVWRCQPFHTKSD